jgi:acyl-coenzyme A synthetase/AMP-(fatty) acid ligase
VPSFARGARHDERRSYRISPIEVENRPAQHPDIQEVAAVELWVKSDASVVAFTPAQM